MTNLYGKNIENGTGAADVKRDFASQLQATSPKGEGRKKWRKGKKEGRKENSGIRIRYFFKESLKIKELILSDAGGWPLFTQVMDGITSILTWLF